ncbi:MAG: hypothetical protein D3903_15450 [Candidatus Electrothrix sp. GM3_4]|nr:hypothetical protein [Candidatus Electrothrix sp. GM3_4]
MAIHVLTRKPGKTGRKSAKKLISDTIIFFERKKQRRHELWILTCYVDLDLVEKYTDHLLKVIRLTDVYLAFNFAEIYKETPCGTKNKLDKISKNLQEKGINFEWQALVSSKLVHSKGYAIIQRVEGVVAGGLTLITSANFTPPGFEGQNIELGYLSQKKKDIRDFESAYDSLWDELGKEIDQAIFQQNAYLFRASSKIQTLIQAILQGLP